MTSGSAITKPGLSIRFKPYILYLRHSFNLSGSSRTTTPVILTEIDFEGITGYGEASLPPYLDENQESVIRFLSSLDLNGFRDPMDIGEIMDHVDSHMPGNYAAKASVDIALHDLAGKLSGLPLYRLLGLDMTESPYTSYTIGIDTPDTVRRKVLEAETCKILKVKLGRDNDREMIEVIRSLTDKPLYADVNQGWKNKEYALEMIHWLREKNVVLVEQPMPAGQTDDMMWLNEKSPLPLLGDEAIQGLHDLIKYRNVYSGVNVKLMKCGGIRAALLMLVKARELGLKTMIGCMTETSCAVTAAAHLCSLADWCDLDGNLLIDNDIYDGVKIIDGRITLDPDKAGLGINPRCDSHGV